MSMVLDAVVYDKYGQLLLVAEAKALTGKDAVWAERMQHNLCEHPDWPRAPYFLLAMLDIFYLWTPGNGGARTGPPDYVTDAAPILERYLDSDRMASGALSSEWLGLFVSWWFRDMAALASSGASPPPGQEWLTESGLFDALKRVRVASEVEVVA